MVADDPTDRYATLDKWRKLGADWLIEIAVADEHYRVVGAKFGTQEWAPLAVGIAVKIEGHETLARNRNAEAAGYGGC